MTRSDLIERVAKRRGLTQKQSEAVVMTLFKVMSSALKAGAPVKIRGFGSFSVKQYKPYAGRNPKTGAAFQVKAKKNPVFRASENLKIHLSHSAQGGVRRFQAKNIPVGCGEHREPHH
jgi:integration host factor subunit beta